MVDIIESLKENRELLDLGREKMGGGKRGKGLRGGSGWDNCMRGKIVFLIKK